MIYVMRVLRLADRSKVLIIKKMSQTSNSFCTQPLKNAPNKEKANKTNFSGVILGSVLGFIGSVVGSFIQLRWQQHQQTMVEDDVYASKEKEMKNYIKQSERNIIHARESFISLQGKHVIDQALILARRDAEKALKIMDEMRSKDILLIEKNDGYTKDSILHLIAYIDYHRGTLLLRSFDCDNAKSMLSQSLARRLSLPPIGPYTENEVNRTKIKIADVSSQTRDIDQAIRIYEKIAEPFQADTLIGSFWKVRAMNNHGIVLFSIGVDSEALSLMTNSATSADVWFMKNIVHNNLSEEDIGCLETDMNLLRNAAFHNQCCSDRKPSEFLLTLIQLGTVDTVDILQLSKSSDFYPFSSEIVKDVFLNRKSALFAIECIERVRLMMRKRITAKANCVLFRSHPFSDYDEEDLDLVGLMEKLMSDDNYTVLFKVIDKNWMQQEGRLRILTAVVTGMLCLYEDGIKTHDTHDWSNWKSLLDNFTSELLTVSKSYTYPVSNVHKAYAHFVRGRFLLLSGDKANALKEFETIYEWTYIEQKRARKKMKELKANGITWSRNGVPPRHARLHISNMILMSELVSDDMAKEKLLNSLKFALETFHLDQSHTLQVAANRALNLKKQNVFSWSLLNDSEKHPQINISKYDAILAKAEATKKILDELSNV